MTDPKHRNVCLMCSKAQWRQDHPVAAEIQLAATAFVFGLFIVLTTLVALRG